MKVINMCALPLNKQVSVMEINRNRYARLVEDQMQKNENYKESLDHFNEILSFLEKGAEITYHENPNTNAIYCEARLILDQMDNLASEQILSG